MNEVITTSILVEFLRIATSMLKDITAESEHIWGAADFRIFRDGQVAHATKRPSLSALIRDPAMNEKVFGSLKQKFESDPRLIYYRQQWSPDTYKESVCGGLNSDYLPRAILQDYFERIPALAFDDAIAKSVAEGFAESWKSGFTDIRLFAVVRDMEGTFTHVQLAPGLCLRRFTYQEAVRFRERNQGTPWSRVGTPDGVPPNLYVLCEDMRLTIGEAARMSMTFSKRMFNALTALRLLCIDVRQLGILSFDTIKAGQYCPWIGISLPKAAEHSNISPYPCYIDQDYANIIPDLFESIENLRSENAFRTALDRFDASKLRHRAEDVLLDATIILEALFGSGSGEGVSYKIMMRCARLVGANVESRMAIMQQIKNIYATRSAIVHGRGKPPKNLESHTRQVLELSRISIILVLEIANKNERFILDNHMDNLLLS